MYQTTGSNWLQEVSTSPRRRANKQVRATARTPANAPDALSTPLQAGGRGFESHRLHTIVSTEKVLLTALRSLQSMRRRVVVTFT